MNHELAKTLTTALVQFIDRERPEGTMCCSSAECERIESSFKLGDFPSIEQFVKKKLSRLTEFEQEVSDIVEYCKEHGGSVAFDYAKRHAKSLLAFAKKELFKQGEGTYYYSPKNDELIYVDSITSPLLPQEHEKDGLVVTIQDKTYYSVKAPDKTNCEDCDIFKAKKPVSMIDAPLCYSYSLNNHKIVDYCRSKRVIWKRAK